MEKHPTRQELMSAAKARSSRIAAHLGACEDCRQLFEMFTAFPVAGEIALPDAPTGWIIKARSIAVSSNPLFAIKGLAAKLSFDSWKIPHAVGVRSQGGEQDRRLRFEVGSMVLDLRAEKGTSGWDFTAQVTGEMVSPELVRLLADKQEVTANTSGFYEWSSIRPPKYIRIKADDLQLELPELSWKPSSRT